MSIKIGISKFELNAYGCFDSAGEGVMLRVGYKMVVDDASGKAKATILAIGFGPSDLDYLKTLAVNITEWERRVLDDGADGSGLCVPEEFHFPSSCAGMDENTMMEAVRVALRLEVAKR